MISARARVTTSPAHHLRLLLHSSLGRQYPLRLQRYLAVESASRKVASKKVDVQPVALQQQQDVGKEPEVASHSADSVADPVPTPARRRRRKVVPEEDEGSVVGSGSTEVKAVSPDNERAQESPPPTPTPTPRRRRKVSDKDPAITAPTEPIPLSPPATDKPKRGRKEVHVDAPSSSSPASDVDGQASVESIQPSPPATVKAKRGRKPSVKAVSAEDASVKSDAEATLSDDQPLSPPVKAKRGRKPSVKEPLSKSSIQTSDVVATLSDGQPISSPTKAKRGRKPSVKDPLSESSPSTPNVDAALSDDMASAPSAKPKRGRKASVQEPLSSPPAHEARTTSQPEEEPLLGQSPAPPQPLPEPMSQPLNDAPLPLPAPIPAETLTAPQSAPVPAPQPASSVSESTSDPVPQPALPQISPLPASSAPPPALPSPRPPPRRKRPPSSDPIIPILPWSDHHTVSRLRQLVNVGQRIADTRKEQPGGRHLSDTPATTAMFKAIRRPMWTHRLYQPGSPANTRSKLISQARDELQRLAAFMDPASDDEHAQYALIVASFLSQAASQSGTTSIAAERTYALTAAEHMFRLVDMDSQADVVVRKALYGQALAHAERHQEAFSVAASALGDFLPNLRDHFKRGQQNDPDAVRNSQQFQEMSLLLQVIIESRLRRIVLTIGSHAADVGHRDIDKPFAPRHWRRKEMLRIKKLSNDADALRKHRRRRSNEAFRALVRRRAIEQLMASLLPLGHLLSLPSSLFPGPTRALDDVVCALGTAQIHAAIGSTLALTDKSAAAETLAAIGASLLRSERLSDAISLYLRSHNAQHVQVPERFARELIRHASRARHNASVDQILNKMLGSRANDLTGDGPLPKMEAKTWLVVGGHLAVMGKHEELSMLWRRLVEAHPEQRGSPALKDQHLIAYARSPGCLRLFKRHLAQYWNVPDFTAGGAVTRNPRKRDMNAETYGRAVQAHAYFGDLSTARAYLDHMATTEFGQDVDAFNSLLGAYVSVRDAHHASEVWYEMQDKGIVPNEASYTRMAILFAEQGDMASALAMLRAQDAAGIPRRQRPMTWMMHHLIKCGEFDEAISIFRSLAERPDIELSIQAYNCMLKILVRRAAPYQIVMNTIQTMQKDGHQMDEATYQLAMQSACDADRVVEAEDLFAQLDGPYQAYRHQKIREAKERAVKDGTLGAWRKRGEEAEDEREGGRDGDDDDDARFDITPPPDFLKVGAQSNHFTMLIDMHLRLGNVDAAKEYFHEMTKRGIEKDAVTWSVLVKAYVETGSSENLRLAREIVASQTQAQQAERRALLDEVADPSEREAMAAFHRPSAAESLLGPLLYDAAQQGKTGYVDRAVTELAEQGVELSLRTLTLVLIAHGQADNVEGMLLLWRRIFEQATRASGGGHVAQKLESDRGSNDRSQEHASLDSGVTERTVQRNALCLPLNIMMNALITHRRHEEVAMIWQETRRAGFAFDPRNWNTLAYSCAQVGRIEPALQIIENVLNEMPPPDEDERYREMRRAIEAAFEGKKMRGPYFRGDEEIVSPSRGVERREQQMRRQNPSLGKAFLAARSGEPEALEAIEEPSGDEDDASLDSSETTSTSLETVLTSLKLPTNWTLPPSSSSSPSTTDLHPILSALREQDAIESATYMWQPFYRTRREIAALLATRVGIDDRRLDTSPNEGDYLEREGNRELLERYPAALRIMRFHIQGCVRQLEMEKVRSASAGRR